MAEKLKKQDFLVIGYKAAIILAFTGILASAIYLFSFLHMSPEISSVQNNIQLVSLTAERRMLLLSTAIFIAMSFGFLGFALFLIQAKGDLDLEGSINDYKLKIARLSPGLFVILCSTVMIIIAATYPIEYRVGNTSGASKIRTNPTAGKITNPDVSFEKLGLTKPTEADTTLSNTK